MDVNRYRIAASQVGTRSVQEDFQLERRVVALVVPEVRQVIAAVRIERGVAEHREERRDVTGLLERCIDEQRNI